MFIREQFFSFALSSTSLFLKRGTEGELEILNIEKNKEKKPKKKENPYLYYILKNNVTAKSFNYDNLEWGGG